VERLVAGQRVTIDVDSEDEVIDALAASVDESRLLLYVRRASPSALGRLISGSLAYLLYTHRGALVGLRGLARITPQTRPLSEFIIDTARPDSDRRGSERVPIVTRARVAGLDADDRDDPSTTFTANISATGVLLKRPHRPLSTDRVSLELFFGSDPVPVSARGEIVRSTDEHLGIHFLDIAPTDVLRLRGLLAGHQRRHRLVAGS
jgi:hypothetical protein